MKISALALTTALTLFGTFASAATTYSCPDPSTIRCVPAVSRVGDWVSNGGASTGNSFTPNNQCANVIPLTGGMQRLLCCYEKCGVFLRDVTSTSCVKTSESQFSCM